MADLQAIIWDDGATQEALRQPVNKPIAVDLEAYIRSIVAQTGGGSGGGIYFIEFGNTDLSVVGILVKQHNLGVIPSAIAVYDQNGELIYPDRIEALTANAIALNLESFQPLPGTWRLVVDG